MYLLLILIWFDFDSILHRPPLRPFQNFWTMFSHTLLY